MAGGTGAAYACRDTKGKGFNMSADIVILSGAADFIRAQNGLDYISGGSGDDVIYGDGRAGGGDTTGHLDLGYKKGVDRRRRSNCCTTGQRRGRLRVPSGAFTPGLTFP